MCVCVCVCVCVCECDKKQNIQSMYSLFKI